MKLTASQAAKLAGVSRSLIYQLCEERRLPHLRLGTKGRRGRILIEEFDLLTFLEECRIEQEPGSEKIKAPVQLAGFTQLDSGRLLDAWRRQGAISSPKDERNSR